MPKIGRGLLFAVIAVALVLALVPVTAVQSNSELPTPDQAVSTSSPMAGSGCFKICRSPGGVWVCKSWPVEDLCAVVGNHCYMYLDCYICQYPCD